MKLLEFECSTFEWSGVKLIVVWCSTVEWRGEQRSKAHCSLVKSSTVGCNTVQWSSAIVSQVCIVRRVKTLHYEIV